LNEFESININKLSTETNVKKNDNNSKTYNFFNNFNNKDGDKSPGSVKVGKNKSYNISSSLPSRNLGNKVVDDIKSLFDKLTSSSKNNSNNKHNLPDSITIVSPLSEDKKSILKENHRSNNDSANISKLKSSQSFQLLAIDKQKKKINIDKTYQSQNIEQIKKLSSHSFSEIRQINNDKSLHNTRIIVFKPIDQIASESSESPDSPKKGN
jgi:hypothetical protein